MGSNSRGSVGNIKNANLKIGVELENKIKDNTKIIQEIQRVNNIVLDLKKKAIIKAHGEDEKYLKRYVKGTVDKETSLYKNLLTLERAHLLKKMELSKKHNVDELKMKLVAIEKARKEAIRADEKSIKDRAKIQAQWDKRRQKLNREANAKKRADAIRSEKEEKKAWDREFAEYLKRTERIQKEWNARRRRNNKIAKKREEDDKMKMAKQANKNLTAENKKLEEIKSKQTKQYAMNVSKMIISIDKKTNEAKAAEYKKYTVRVGQLDTAMLNKRVKQQSSNRKTGALQTKSVGKPTTGQQFMGGFNDLATKAGVMAGYAAIGGAVTLAAVAMKKAIAVSIEYEKVLADLQARGGFTKDETLKLADSIMNVASATKYSFDEISKAAVVMAKLGINAEELNESLMHVATTAAAAGESLEEVGAAMAKTSNIFSLGAEDFQQIGDVMTKAFTSSALDLKGYTNAMSYAGAAAEATGTSYIQLTSAMEVLADRGITASKIGTGLRNIFMEMGEEGHDLNMIIKELADGSMSYYEATELVGKRAANQLFLLAENYEEMQAKQEELMSSSGESAARAAVQMDTFDAQWTAFMNEVSNTTAKTGQETLGFWASMIKKMRAMTEDGEKNIQESWVRKNKDLAKRLIEAMGDSNSIDAKTLEENFTQDERDELKSSELYQGAKKGRKSATFFGMKEQYAELEEEEKLEKKKIALQKWALDSENKLKRDVQHAFKKEGKEGAERLISDYWAKIDPKELAELKKQGIEYNDIVEYTMNTSEKMAETIHQQTIGKDIKEQFKGIEDLDLFNKMFKEQEGKRFEIVKNAAEKFTKQEITLLQKEADRINAERQVWCDQGIDRFCVGKKKGRGKKREFEKVEAFDKGEIGVDYQKTKQRLEDDYKQAGIDGDPDVQLKIKKLMVANEEQYLNDMLKAREDYVKYIEVLRVKNEVNMAKHKGTEEYQRFKNHDTALKNVQTTQSNAGHKDEEGSIARVGAIGRRSTAGVVESDFYEADAVAARKYAAEIMEIELEIDNAKNPWKKKKLYDKQVALTEQFYKDQKASIAKGIADIQDERAKMLEIDDTADVSSQDKAIKKLEGKGSDVEDKEEEFEGEKNEWDSANVEEKQEMIRGFATQAVGVSEDIYNIYRQYREEKLNALREEVAAELDIINERYTEENKLASAALKAGVITQKQYEESRKKIEKKKTVDENTQNKKLFEAEKASELENAKAEMGFSIAKAAIGIWASYASNPILSAVLTAVSAGAIAIQSGMQIKAIKEKKFTPKKYSDGGLAIGKSHAAGGIPFTIAGNPGHEMEGGEFIVNKEATKANLNLLNSINGTPRKFATGGVVENSDDTGMTEALNGLTEVLGNPARAYVMSGDLASDEEERALMKERTTYN